MDAITPPDRIKSLYKPFYSLPVVAALNGENMVIDMNERRGADIHFTAPKARVLIVDDNPINLKVAAGLMRPYNMQLMTAESGRAAIKMLRSRDIDLVFMDHMMPEMDGVEAVQIIRAMEGEYYQKLPIIALTANAVNGARDMFMSSGFNDFLAKPIELTYLEGNDCDAVLLDINMPEMDGFEVLEKIRRIKRCQNLPVIFLTADNDRETEARCFNTGAVDFIAKPFVPEVMRSRISRVLELEDLRRGLEKQVAEKTAHIHYIKDMMVLGMAEMVESRDSNTGGHIKRTSEVIRVFSHRLAQRCDLNGVDERLLRRVEKAAPMHDLGKIAISDSVLRKPGKYTEEEFNEMKLHSAEGAKIVENILGGVEDDEFVQIAKNIAHYHHEKWNGRGYPEGLSKTDIPVEARIMALADVFDALVSKRCYKEAFSYDKAFAIIEESLGEHFDPELGRVFLDCREELTAMYDSFN